VAVLAMGGRADDEALQAVAEREEQRGEDHGRNVRIEPEQAVGEERREHGGAQERAMGEVDDVQDAVDQGEAERHQRVDRAGEKPVEDGRNQDGRRQHARAQAGGIGNTGFADAKAVGKMTWMSLPSTCVFTGAAPSFWPLTNLVGPYGITWPAKVEPSSAVMILARSADAARSIASASSSTHE